MPTIEAAIKFRNKEMARLLTAICILTCLQASAGRKIASPKSCARQLGRWESFYLSREQAFEKSLHQLFRNGLNLVVRGDKPVSELKLDGTYYSTHEFFLHLEKLREERKFENNNIGWFFAESTTSAKEGGEDQIYFYNKIAIHALIENKDAMKNLKKAGLGEIHSAADVIRILKSSIENRNPPTTNERLFWGTVFGYPPEDVRTFVKLEEGDITKGRAYRVSHLGSKNEDQESFGFRTFLPVGSKQLKDLEDRSWESLKWYEKQRREGKSDLELLINSGRTIP